MAITAIIDPLPALPAEPAEPAYDGPPYQSLDHPHETILMRHLTYDQYIHDYSRDGKYPKTQDTCIGIHLLTLSLRRIAGYIGSRYVESYPISTGFTILTSSRTDHLTRIPCAKVTWTTCTVCTRMINTMMTITRDFPPCSWISARLQKDMMENLPPVPRPVHRSE